LVCAFVEVQCVKLKRGISDGHQRAPVWRAAASSIPLWRSIISSFSRSIRIRTRPRLRLCPSC